MWKEPKIHSGHMEVAVAKLVGYRRNVIVPNVSWGLGLHHECDMLYLDDKGRFTEVEIKISLSDLRADFKKWHQHKSNIISRLQYAVPEKLAEHALNIIPKGSGLIVVSWDEHLGYFVARYEVVGTHNKACQKPKPETVQNFMRLGCMRIWSLKSVNNKIKLEKLEEEICNP